MKLFLERNNEADVLFTVGREDPLIDAATIDDRMLRIGKSLAHYTNGFIRNVIINGSTHGPHTFTPQFVHAITAQLG